MTTTAKAISTFGVCDHTATGPRTTAIGLKANITGEMELGGYSVETFDAVAQESFVLASEGLILEHSPGSHPGVEITNVTGSVLGADRRLGEGNGSVAVVVTFLVSVANFKAEQVYDALVDLKNHTDSFATKYKKSYRTKLNQRGGGSIPARLKVRCVRHERITSATLFLRT